MGSIPLEGSSSSATREPPMSAQPTHLVRGRVRLRLRVRLRGRGRVSRL